MPKKQTKKNNDTNVEIIQKNKEDLQDLEKMYVTSKLDTFISTIEDRREDITKELVEYSKNNQVPVFNRKGEIINYKTKLKPLVITNYFFKPIITTIGQEPKYSAEKLGIVFDYYNDLIAVVNDEIGDFPPSITSFCKLAGISQNTLRAYRYGADDALSFVANKIYDEIGDGNITMGQLKQVDARTTIFKMKSQNEMVEKAQPQVRITINDEPDLDQIQERLKKYSSYARKKDKK